MLLFNITRRINKALAPNLLSWSLRLHEMTLNPSKPWPLQEVASSFSHRLLLPFAQRLVSIEVQDDYYHIRKNYRAHLSFSSSSLSSSSSWSSWWDDFVDKTWALFFQDYHKQYANKAMSSSKLLDIDQLAEQQAQQLYKTKQKKRQDRRRQRKGESSRRGQSRVDDDGIRDDNIRFNRGYYNNEDLLDLSRKRLQILFSYIRPALHPSSATKNWERPLFQVIPSRQQQQQLLAHNNFVKWLRGEYLIAKYGLAVQKAVTDHPELRSDTNDEITIHESICDHLPSVKTVIQAFGMEDWSRHKTLIPVDDNEKDLCADDVDRDMEYIIHNKLGGQITHAGPLNAYFEMRRQMGVDSCYELWTREYIYGLAQYILNRVVEMDRDTSGGEKETIVLDVGAGDGRLSYLLRCAMQDIRQDCESMTTLPTVIATDDGSWNSVFNPFDWGRSSSVSTQHHVERLSVTESLHKYAPTGKNHMSRRLIVICSWMPPGQDWTADFRRSIVGMDENCPTGYNNERYAMNDTAIADKRIVDEYILIGEADNGACGHNWYTWGNHAFRDANDDNDCISVAPYIKDGYEREDLKELSVLQFSRFDCRQSSESETVSFRRQLYGNRNIT